MNTTWQQFLHQLGDKIVAVLVWPGKSGVAYFIEVAPATSAKLDIIGDAAATNSVVVLSILFWVSCVIATWLVYRLACNIVRIAISTYSMLVFQTSELIYAIKTGIRCRFKRFARQKVAAVADSAGELEIDDLDLAVLRCAAAAGPGFAISAPELAEELTLRPAQIQRCLEKLSNNKILSAVIGSTDGFSNYHLSDYGAAFSKMLNSRSSAAA